jgi:hypothetical protein
VITVEISMEWEQPPNHPLDTSADGRTSARPRLLPLAVLELPGASTQLVDHGLPGAMPLSSFYHNTCGPLYDAPHNWPPVDFLPNNLPGGVALGVSSFPMT